MTPQKLNYSNSVAGLLLLLFSLLMVCWNHCKCHINHHQLLYQLFFNLICVFASLLWV